jgi:hypothetical protein
MLPDMTVKVSFLEAGTADTRAMRLRLLTPRRAIGDDNGQRVAFVVRDGRAERVSLRIGAEDGDQVEIQTGLSAGDRIVVGAPDDLSDKVRVQEASVR